LTPRSTKEADLGGKPRSGSSAWSHVEKRLHPQLEVNI